MSSVAQEGHETLTRQTSVTMGKEDLIQFGGGDHTLLIPNYLRLFFPSSGSCYLNLV